MARLMRRLTRGLIAALLSAVLLSWPAWAATEVIEIYFLPMQEAADAARSQLSDRGKVASLPSRRMLIVDDDAAHLNKVKALLKRLDHPPGQYTAFVSIEDIKSAQRHAVAASGHVFLAHIVPGQMSAGWVQLDLQGRQQRVSQRQSFQLRLSSHHAGSIEVGTIRSLNRASRTWLAAYGVLQANSVEMVPLTSGFHITVSPAGVDKVRVRIMPWMRRSQPQLQAQQEILVDLGSSANPALPASNNANMRLNVQALQTQPVIEIAAAATELIIPVGESVSLMASNREAERFGHVLLSRFSSVEKRSLVMHLRVIKSR